MVYDYLSRDSRALSMTSIALLLGMASCHVGTRDQAVTKMLTVHVPSLHPELSTTDLEVQPSVQIAAVMGLGLLYLGTTHRRMTEVFYLPFLSFLSCALLSPPFPSFPLLSPPFEALGFPSEDREASDRHHLPLPPFPSFPLLSLPFLNDNLSFLLLPSLLCPPFPFPLLSLPIPPFPSFPFLLLKL
jgi:hypothetical protein